MGLYLTYNVNCKISTLQTAGVLKELHGIQISHRTVANYTLISAYVLKTFVDKFDCKATNILSADETYIKLKALSTMFIL